MSVKPKPRQPSLLRWNIMTIGFSLLLMMILTLVLLAQFVLFPVAQRSADDLAGLMLLSAKTWTELPPQARPDFSQELKQNYGLHIVADPHKLTVFKPSRPYLDFLLEALSRRSGTELQLGIEDDEDGILWADIPFFEQSVRLGFERHRIGAQPGLVLLMSAGLGLLTIGLLTIFLSRRLSRPLIRLSTSLHALGEGLDPGPLTQQGPYELANLAQEFNSLFDKIQDLLEGRTLLLAGISHDLRTPLTRLTLALEMLPEDSAPTLVRRMQRDLELMNVLIARFMELARDLSTAPSDEPARPLQDVLQDLHEDHGGESAQLRLTLSGNCPNSHAPQALHRLLGNLLENALRYAGNGPIDIAASCGDAEHAVQITISDQGPGIPAQQLEEVFRPFYRLQGARSQHSGGSGLGLAIARQIANAHGWQLVLVNAPDGGLQATLTMPAIAH